MSCASALTQRISSNESASSTSSRYSTFSFGFGASSDRSLQAFLERFVEVNECDELAYISFTNWFSQTFVALLRETLDNAIEDLDSVRNDLRGRLESI